MRLTVLSFLHSLTHEVERILWKPMFGNRTATDGRLMTMQLRLHASQSVRRVHALLPVEARLSKQLETLTKETTHGIGYIAGAICS